MRIEIRQAGSGRSDMAVSSTGASAAASNEDEAHMLLVNDIERTDRELRTAFKWFRRLDDRRRAAIVDMAFNLGLSRFGRFTRMIAHLGHGEFDEAARDALDSKWARQVGKRAHDIADMIRGRPEMG